MLHTEERMQAVAVGFTCDRCATKIDVADLACQEALHIDMIGGYASVFGDGTKVQCDLCQDCVKAVLGEFCKVTSFLKEVNHGL